MGVHRYDGGGRAAVALGVPSWQPPAETDFGAGFYGYADGTGGFALVETDSAAGLAKAMAPFTPWLSFTARAILPIQEAAAIAGEAVAFRDSIQ